MQLRKPAGKRRDMGGEAAPLACSRPYGGEIRAQYPLLSFWLDRPPNRPRQSRFKCLFPGAELPNNSWTENHGSSRGRTLEAQWHNDRLLTVSYRASKRALRRGSGDYHGKRQGGRERTAPYLPANKRSYSTRRMNRRKAHSGFWNSRRRFQCARKTGGGSRCSYSVSGWRFSLYALIYNGDRLRRRTSAPIR